MYEEKTFGNIQKDMLARVRDDVDKREGSVIWDSTAAVAYSLAEMYFQMENYPDLILPDTSAGEYLDRLIQPFGIERKEAAKSIRKVTADGIIPVGSRWQLQDTSYTVTAGNGNLEYTAECEQYGIKGNLYYGNLEPISNGVSVGVVLGEVITPGAETETDDSLRERFLAGVRRPSTSGNIYDYYNWAMSCKGVGAAKIFPLSDGPGTVKVVVASDGMKSADEAVLKGVKDVIEEMRPIGATVTVTSAEELAVNVTAKIKLSNGLHLGAVQSAFRTVLEEFLHDSAFELSYVGYARVGNILLGTAGVEDYAELSTNGYSGNIRLTDEQIAVVGAVTLEVMPDGDYAVL